MSLVSKRLISTFNKTDEMTTMEEKEEEEEDSYLLMLLVLLWCWAATAARCCCICSDASAGELYPLPKPAAKGPSDTASVANIFDWPL